MRISDWSSDVCFSDLGFVPLIFSILLALLVLALPSAPEMPAERLAAFNTMMSATPWIWVGGIVAYGVSQMLNVTIFSWLKGREGGSLLWFRAGVASVFSQDRKSVVEGKGVSVSVASGGGRIIKKKKEDRTKN